MANNILITGSRGQLGSELSELFGKYPDYRFFATDIAELDLTDKSAIQRFIEENRIDFIVNCAAYTAVDKAEDDVDLCYKINRDAVRNLAEAAQGRACIIHVSTDYVFDGKNDRPYLESDPTDPQSVYGASKRAGEEILTTLCPESSIIIRTAWLYSIYGNNFVKTMIRLGKERSELNVVADQQGTPTYAADLAQAIMQIIDYTIRRQVFHAGIYHFTDEGATNWFEFTREIHRLAGVSACVVHPIPTAQYPTKATRPMYSILDKTKIKQTFGIDIPDWKTSLKTCIQLLNL
ncbi:MAG: dTDP-4-dehydrorhamnose reductase [Candidatus Symbiothrix sp.]|jgi:dTDP-4-dehydrorhamnose reductase|nr:dTDP-4-dehydrorhamnose reductase [Candidatus Symbiothrix sp.]